MDLKFDLIGERIKHFREAKDISQEELSAILDTSVRHISAIETGTRGISLSLLVDIANALDISSDDILVLIIPCSGKHQSAERKTSFHGKENTTPHKESSNPLMESTSCIIELEA